MTPICQTRPGFIVDLYGMTRLMMKWDCIGIKKREKTSSNCLINLIFIFSTLKSLFVLTLFSLFLVSGMSLVYV